MHTAITSSAVTSPAPVPALSGCQYDKTPRGHWKLTTDAMLKQREDHPLCKNEPSRWIILPIRYSVKAPKLAKLT